MNKNALIRSAFIGASVAIVFVVAITILGDLYKVTLADGKVLNPIKEFLKALHGHHWVGKGIWAVALFCLTSGIVYLIGRKNIEDRPLEPYISFLTYMIIVGTAAIFGFYIYEYSIH